MKTLRIIALALASIALLGCSHGGEKIWSVNDSMQITCGGQPQYFIGTNFWCAPRLAVENPERLAKELDFLKEHGITNLRILAAESDLDAIGAALDALAEREMSAVLFMNNAWEWSTGYLTYLEKAGYGHQPHPAVEGYQAYMKAMAQFVMAPEAQELSWEHLRAVVSRFKGHKAVFSWQICNEPRCFSSDPEVKDAFVTYIHTTAALIKSIDPVHMVSTGNEGMMGCEEDIELFKRIHDCAYIDYATIHIWAYNWKWASSDDVAGSVDNAIARTNEYISSHLDAASQIGKAVVIEEFGYPRDNFSFEPGSPTVGRDAIYENVFMKIVESAKTGGNLAGANFWAWGGYGDPAHKYWEEGDDYVGDPFQEEQGLNSVFVKDSSTIAMIDRIVRLL